MGYVTFTGVCCCCNKIFSFHPNKVPSFKGEPICKTCVEKINIKRKENKLPPITILPGAYNETHDEQEIDWGY